MAKVDLITITGLTASDGSVVASGATLKFNSEFFAASTKVKITPKLYRNRELFENGFSEIKISEEIIPVDFMMEFNEEDFYVMTPLVLYQEVGKYLNNMLGDEYFELKVIED
jgi:hypothetical protein